MYNKFSKFPVKRVFNERFNIPELFTEDVSENEKELKYLLPIFKFSSTARIHQALEHDFHHGTMINTLFPHLTNYYSRYMTQYLLKHDFSVLIKRQMCYEHFFLNGATLFKELIHIFFIKSEYIRGLQQYILSHPEQMEHVCDYFNLNLRGDLNIQNASAWIITALESDMPDSFFEGFPDCLVKALFDFFTLRPSIWILLDIPIDRYRAIFLRINILIDSLRIENWRNREYLMLSNAIRFGPEDSTVYDERILPKQYTYEKLIHLCHCASLANNEELFAQLFSEIHTYVPDDNGLLKYWSKIWASHQRVTFDTYKVLIQIHEHSSKEGRQQLHNNDWFLKTLSKHCRITSIEWGHNESTLVLKPPKTSDIPEQIVIYRKFISCLQLWYFLRQVPDLMTFDDIEVFERFIILYFLKCQDHEYKCHINSENLRLVIKSKTLHHQLRECFPNIRITFSINVDELLKIIDEPAPHFAEYYNLKIMAHYDIYLFKTREQLQKLETLLGHSVSLLVNTSSEYFHNRHIFRYLFQTGQKLPEKLDRNIRKLLEIDFPREFAPKPTNEMNS